ncbi:MAG: hypothetical protein M3464_02545 [Chloroflexota bacterium]|nr:hypothetical protein [Chloroflexota bacterium]
MVVAQFAHSLRQILSEDRLEAYRPENGADLEMLTNYFWNIRLGEALMPCLHAVELALRNSIHTEFAEHYGNDMWFYIPGVLDSGGIEKLSDALRQAAHKPPLTAGKLVAAFTFGFWVSLFASRHEEHYWRPNNFARLQDVFPHASNPSLKNTYKRMQKILELRNRVFHYEGIWYRPALPQEHHDIHEVIGWISPVMHQAILAVDNFPEVYRNRSQIEANLQAHLGLP